ncbi:PREDICTED: uncharacterized protein LOC108764410, partial [Trachymyrmex cornetzi]|uniref:uncharacterized protein LOC108764410 n=1 Tax=Trachymyrmex cornetzi TaxID=471704 RepID=UPI00084F2D0E
IVHLDGAQARKPRNEKFNQGNVEFELLIQRGTVITTLGNYHSKLEQTEPHYVKLSEVMNTSHRIILEAYIKTNFITKYHHKFNKHIGCGSVSDGFYKLETHITNFNEKEYSALKYNKGDKVEITGTMQNSSIPPYLIVDNVHDIKRKDGKMSLIQLYKANETFRKRKADDNE